MLTAGPSTMPGIPGQMYGPGMYQVPPGAYPGGMPGYGMSMWTSLPSVDLFDWPWLFSVCQNFFLALRLYKLLTIEMKWMWRDVETKK